MNNGGETMTTNLTERVPNEELDHLIWGLERYGLYPRQLAALKELREWRKAAAGGNFIDPQSRVFIFDWLTKSGKCENIWFTISKKSET